tara:strand:+ start:820 stop:15558 length:14739 start_codon:yes stop_codon:yes gene_type:complete
MGVLDAINTPSIDPITGLSEEETKKNEFDKKKADLLSSNPIDVTGPDAGLGFSRTSLVDQDLYDDALEGSAKLQNRQIGSLNVEHDDLEDRAAFGQSKTSVWANGITKLAGKSLTAAAGGIGALASSIGAIGTYAFTDADAKDSFKGVFDNEFQRGLDNLNEAMDGKLPNYVSKEEREYGFFRSMGTANFWANDLTNGLSFIAGAVITEALLSAATVATFGAAAPVQAATTAAMVARAARMLKLASKGGKAAKALSKVNKVSLGMKARQASIVARQLLSGAGYESGVEARHHLDSVKKELVQSYREDNGGENPEGEDLAYIQDLATQSANAVFGANLALVGYGNAMQFPKIFGAGARSAAKSATIKNARRGIIKDVTDGVVDPFKAAYKSYGNGKKMLSAAYHVGKNPFYEGFVEEGGQKWIDLAGQHAAAEAYTNGKSATGMNAALGIMRAADDTFSEAYGTKESQKEIGIGFLLGAMGLPSFVKTKNKDGSEGKRKYDGMQGGVWDGLKDRLERREHIDRMVKYMNKNPSAVAAVKRNFENYAEQVNLQEQMDAALVENNMFAYKNLENDALFSYLHSRIEGGFYNDIKGEMEEVRNMSDEEFVQEFGYESEDLSPSEIADRKEKVVSSALVKAAKIKEATEAVDQAYIGENDKVRRGLIHAAATIENVDRREEELSNMIDDITDGAMRTDKDSSLYDQLRGTEAAGLDAGPDGNVAPALGREIGGDPFVNTEEDEALLAAWKKKNPTEAGKLDKQEEVKALLRDLRMVRQRRQDFLSNYNLLLTSQGQKEYLQMVDFFMDQENKSEVERVKVENETAIRDGNMEKIFENSREDEFVVDVKGDGTDKKTYKFLDAYTLYNIKDGSDTIPSSVIFNNGTRTAALIEQLDQRGIERRKVREAVQRIQSTNVKKIQEVAKSIEALDVRLAKAIGYIAERLSKKKNNRDAKGRFVSVKNLEEELVVATELQVEVAALRDKLLEDKATLEENQVFLDKMLKATRSEKSLSMEDKLELERQVKEEGLELLSISGTTLQEDGTQKLSKESELRATAEESVSVTEQALEAIMLQVDTLEDDIQKLQDYKDVLNRILKEDRVLQIIKDFRAAHPGIEPTYESITKFTNEDRQKYPALYEIQSSLTPNLFAELAVIEKAKKDQKFLEDEFYATEEKLEDLQSTLAAAKKRESLLLQMAEDKYRGMSKVQRSILFGRNYTSVQDRLSVINQEEQAEEDLARKTPKGTLTKKAEEGTEGTSTEEVFQDDPEDFGIAPEETTEEKQNKQEQAVKDENYKPDLATVGYNKTAGIDRADKANNLDPKHMSPSQRTFFKFVDSLSNAIVASGAYKVIAVTKDNNPFDTLSDDSFYPDVDGQKDIILVVCYQKTGLPVKMGDSLVYTSMMLPKPIEYFSSKLEEAEKVALHKELTDEHIALRTSIESKEKGKNIYLELTGISKGMPHYGPKVRGEGAKSNRYVFPKNSVLGRITQSIESVHKIPLVIATKTSIAEFSASFRAIIGEVYAVHKGRPVRMEKRNLNATEIETVIQVLTKYGRAIMSTDPAVKENADVIEGSDNQSVYKYLKEIIKFGRWEGFKHNPKFNIHTRMEGGIEMLYVGGVKMDIRSLDSQSTSVQKGRDPETGVMKEATISLYNEANVEVLRKFLANKTHNIDKKLIGNAQAPYTEFTIDSEGNFVEGTTYKNYKEYLMMPREGNESGAPLGTALIQEDPDNVNLTQFKFTYLKFNSSVPQVKPVQKPIVQKPVEQPTATPQENPGEGTDFSAFTAALPAADPVPAPTPVVSNPEMGTSTDINSSQMTQGVQYDLVYTTAAGKQNKYIVIKEGSTDVLTLLDPLNDLPDGITSLIEATNKMALEGITFNEAFGFIAASTASVTGNLTIENIVLDPTVVANSSTIEEKVIQDSKPAVPAAPTQTVSEVELPKVNPEEMTGALGLDADNESFLNSWINNNAEDPNDQAADDNVQNLLKEAVTEKYVKADLAKEIAWFEDKFPGIPIKVIKGLIGGKAYGRTLNAARVLISDLAVQGTTYHEAFHVVMGAFTAPETKTQVLEAYSRLTGITENVEEELAEEFRTFILLDGNYKIGEKAGKERNLIQRFFASLKDFFNTMLGRGSKKDREGLQSFFTAIQNNTFSDKTIEAEAEMSLDKRILLKSGSKLSVGLSKDLVESLIADTFGFFFKNSTAVQTDLSLQDLLELADRQHSEARASEVGRLINEAFNVRLRSLAKTYQALPKGSAEASGIMEMMRMIDQNRAEIKDGMFDWLKQFKVDFQGRVEEESTKFRDSYNVNEANEVNAKELAPALVKLLIATLPASRSNRNVNTVYSTGLVDYRPFFNLVMRELAGTESFEDQIAKLEALKSSHPEFGDVGGRKGTISFLIDRLEANAPVESLSPNAFKVQRQFRQQFHKFNSEDMLAIIEDDSRGGNYNSIRFIKANADRESALLIEEFRSNLKEMFSLGKGPFTKDPITEEMLVDLSKKMKIGKRSLSLNDFSEAGVFTADDVVDLLENFGIIFTDKESLTIKEKNAIYQNAVDGVISELIKLGKSKTSIEDFYSTQSGAYSRVKKIIEIQAKRTDRTIDLQFQNAEGKTVYSIILNNFATNIVGRLNSGKIPDFLLDQNGNVKESIQGSLFLEGAMNGLKISLGSINGIKKKSSRFGNVFENASPRRRFNAEFAGIMQGIIPMIRASEKKTEFIFDLTYENDEGESIFKGMPTTRATFVAQMMKYLRMEIYKSKVAAGNNIADYKDNKHKLRLFSYLEDVVDLNAIDINNIDAYLKDNKTAISAGIIKYLEGRNETMIKEGIKTKLFYDNKDSFGTRLHMDVLKSMGNLVSEEARKDKLLTKRDVNNIVERFNMISLVGNIEQTILVLGDVGFFKPNAYFKRTSGPHGPKKFADVSTKVNEWLARNYKRLDEKSPDGRLRTTVYRDVKGRIADSIFLDYAKVFGADVLAMQEKLVNPEAVVDPKTEEVYQTLKGYLEYEEGDAQGYITIDEYMEFLERVGDVTPNQRAVYAKLQAGEKINATEMAYFTPLKPQYYGPTYNSEIYSPAFYKLSLLPLFPALMESVSPDSNLARMYSDMQDKGVGLTVFKSGVKIGAVVDANGEANNFYDETGIYEGIKDANIQELYYEYMGIQVEMGDKVKDKTVRGVQQRGLLSSNAYDNGKVVNADVVKLDRELTKLENETVDAQFALLLDDLGISKTDKGYFVDDKGAEKFADMLMDEAKSRDMSDSYVEGLEEFLATDKETRVLDLLGNKPQIENLLYSLAANRVIRYKTFGAAKVQVASTGFEAVRVKATKQKEHSYGSNVEALKFYRQENGVTMAMEVMLPHYFKQLIGENVEVREDGIYKDGEKIGNSDLLEIFGYRIPTSALNSIDAIVIKGFLPESAGEAIMTPSEIVVKAGSDYDIDKLTLYFPNYVWNKGTNKLTMIKFLGTETKVEDRVAQLRRLDPRKYKLLLETAGFKSGAMKAFQALSKQFQDTKLELGEHLQTVENQEILKRIDELYSKKRKANKAQKDNLDYEIGIEFSKLIKTIGIDDAGADVSLQSQLSKIESLFEKMDSQLVATIKADEAKKVPTISIERQNAQKAIDNAILTKSREIVLHPMNFEQLIRPVGADRLKGQANEIRGVQNKNQEKVDFSKLMEFEYIQEMGTRFWVGKQALGVAAVTNTHQIKAQRAGLAIKVKEKINIPFPHHEVIVDENGDLSYGVGHAKDVSGLHYISEVIGEFINAFVDVANDPFVFDINANLITAGAYFGLLRIGVPLKHVTRYMTQDSIVRYVAAQTDLPGVSKNDVIDDVLEELNGFSPTMAEGFVSKASFATVEELEVLLKRTPELVAYEEAVTAGMTVEEAMSLTTLTKEEVHDYYASQVDMLELYVAVSEGIAGPLSKLSQAVVGDRGGMTSKSRMETRIRDMQLSDLIMSDKFNNLDKYLEGSFQRSFEEAQREGGQMFNDLFMSDKDPAAKEVVYKLVKRVMGRALSLEDKAKYGDLVEHNFVSFVLATVGVKGDEIFTHASRLFQGNDSTPSLPRRIKHMKDAMRASGEKSLILNELFPILQKYDPTDTKFRIENIKKFSKRLTSYDRNVLIEDFQILMDKDPKLADDIVKFIIMQSGQMTSPISFLDIIPTAHYMRIVKPIIENFLLNPKSQDLSIFPEQFIRNNHKNEFVVERLKKQYLTPAESQNEEEARAKKLLSNEVKVTQNIAHKGMPIYKELQDYISIELEDPFLTAAEIKRRKDRKQSTKEVYLFKLAAGMVENQQELRQWLEDGKDYKQAPPHWKEVKWKQTTTLGDGMFLKEYGLGKPVSIIRKNNITKNNIDWTTKTADRNLKTIIAPLETQPVQQSRGVNEVADGISIIKDALTPSEEKEIFNLIKVVLEAQGTQSNVGKYAPLMIGLGLRWDYKSNNVGRAPIAINATINNSTFQRNKYAYYGVASDGSPLMPMPARLKELMTKATGIDATNYDGAIVNLYREKSFISAHNDVDESATAKGYPVLVANIGGKGSLSIEGAESQRAGNAYNSKEYLNEALESGSAYVLGDGGRNRDVYHRTLPSEGKGNLPALNVQGTNIPANSYRISITLRRVRDLTSGMPNSPKKVTTSPQKSSAGQYYEGNITPDKNTVFVFGSNPEGRHGAGAALVAKKQFGAKNGQGEGLQGNAYALPTKDLRVEENKSLRSISKEEIIKNIKRLYTVATRRKNNKFKVAFRNKLDETTLNGYSGAEMIEMFNAAGSIPSNIIFSKEWFDTGKLNLPKQTVATVIPAQTESVVMGDIFSMDGIPVIATSQDGSLSGLSSIAKAKGLEVSTTYTAKPGLVSLPVKASKDTAPTLQSFITQIGNLNNTMQKSPEKKFLVSLLGLGPIDAQTIPGATYDAMLSGLKALLDTNPNATLVLPNTTNPALTGFIQTMETYFKC